MTERAKSGASEEARSPAADRQAEFLRLFLANQDDIRAVIGSMVRDRASGDDVFQETALVLWRKFEEFDPTRSFGAWARGIAVRKVLQFFDRQHRRPAAMSPEVIESVLQAYEEDEQEDPALRAALAVCLRKLPERSRRLLAMRYDHALKLREMADKLGKKLDAVHKALSRIRDKLRACIEKELVLAD